MLRTELAQLVATLGQPVMHHQTKPPAAVTNVAKCLTQSTSKAPEAIVNSYGVNGREFVFTLASLPTAPEKFDSVTFSGERYVLEVAIPLHEHGSGALMGWRCYSKGR